MIKNQQHCHGIDENERALRFEYRFRRYGIIILSLIILTALSGLWSSGYFSEAHRDSATGELSVDYQRYAGLMSETELNILIHPDQKNETTISFASTLLSRYQIGDIRPQPDKMYSSGEIISRIPADAPSFADVSVAFHYPENGGKYHATGGSKRSSRCHRSQFIYP